MKRAPHIAGSCVVCGSTDARGLCTTRLEGGALAVEAVSRTLRLHVLQSTAAIFMAFVVYRALFVVTVSSAQVFSRALLFVLCGVVALTADERNAPRRGIFLVAVLHCFPLLRAWNLPHAQAVATAIIYGPQRILPLLASLFSGTRASFASGAFAIAGPILVVADLRRRAGILTWDAWWHGTATILVSTEQDLMLAELSSVLTTVAVAYALQNTLATAFGLLANALATKQQFITNMVPSICAARVAHAEGASTGARASNAMGGANATARRERGGEAGGRRWPVCVLRASCVCACVCAIIGRITRFAPRSWACLG